MTITDSEYRLSTWTLDELLPDTREVTLQARLDDLEDRVLSIESRRVQLRADMAPQVLVRILDEYESMVAAAWRVHGYGSLWFSSDTQDEAALTFRTRVQQTLTQLQNRTLFFSLWWQELGDDEAATLLDGLVRAGGTADQRFYLEDLRRLSPYRLDERSEQIANLKDQDGISAILTLYSMLTNAFEFRPEIASVGDQALTRDELMQFAYSPVRGEREAAYDELLRVYEGNAKPLQQMYVHRVQDWYNENVRLRGYESPIAVRNVANDVPGDAIDTMLDVVREGAPLFQRYFRQKADWLGLERLKRTDLYAPLSSRSAQLDFDEAARLVLDVYERFHPRFGECARRVFDQRHLDSAPRRGKAGGAFCATVLPELTPWVLVNFTGRLRDVATLAHELGHAIHSMLAADHSVLTQHASLPLAETASVFGELLVIERLLDQHTDHETQRELLAAAVDDAYATVLRQAFFVLFEREAHEAVRQGASPEQLHAIYHRSLEEQFGSSVEVDPRFGVEWIAIPHIYSTPFYCYAYSFGQLLVLALYQRFLEEGEEFKPKYLELLSHGGSEHPQRILEQVGVDITSAEFWRGGLAVVEGMIERLERLG